jgi:hypothetical protein
MEPTMSRSERQRQQIKAAVERRHYARALVLAREHLAEFPNDDVVRAALAEAFSAWELPRGRDPDKG